MTRLYLAAGIVGIVLFHMGAYPPVIVSVVIFIVVGTDFVLQYRRREIGPLTLLLFATYALPFMHIVPYLWFDFDTEAPRMLWGVVVNPYMTNQRTIELMSMLGAVGAMGFALGTAIPRMRMSGAPQFGMQVSADRSAPTLPMPFIYVLTAVSLVLAWLFAPTDTVFTTAYMQEMGTTEKWNFGSVWLWSYSLLVFVLADASFEANREVARRKRKIFLYAMLIVVVWFQLLRGDRESLTLVVAAGLMYYVWGKHLENGPAKELTFTWPKLAIGVVALAVISWVVGAIRHEVTGVQDISGFFHTVDVVVSTGEARVDTFIAGTWSAALLTPLSVAGDYLNNLLAIGYGRTYVDLLLSVVPGFIADFIGYARPIDAHHGPAWQMTYGLGGTHAVVVPFMEFRMAGVFVILALWGFIFAKLERHFSAHLSVTGLTLLGIVAMVAPHWFWYGEKYIMNALIMWAALAWLHKRVAETPASRRYSRMRSRQY